MGGSRRKAYSNTRRKKRRFHGNQYKNNVTPNPENTEIEAVIKTPVKHKNVGVSPALLSENELLLIDINILSKVIACSTSCGSCHGKSLQLIMASEKKKGLAHKLQLSCSSCNFVHCFYTSGKSMI